MDFWHFYIPVIAVCVLNLIYEICKKQTPDAPQRGLPAVFLCAVLLPAAAIYAGGYAALWCADLFSGISCMIAALLAVTVIVLLTVLLLHLLSNKLHIRRKNRIIAAVLLFLAYLAELTALGLSVLHNI